MGDQERIRQLESELARLRRLVERQARRIAELEAPLAKDSHNSSRPPASDGLARRPHPTRAPNGKRPGGQPGHRGHTLALAETPDGEVTHAPAAVGHAPAA